MQINISARHGEISDETQARIQEKVEKLRRLFDRVAAIDVKVDLGHEALPSVELRLSIERTDPVIASETASNVLTALDGALHKAEQQLRRYKERRRDHKAKGSKRMDTAESSDAEG